MSLSELISGILQPVFDLLPRVATRPAANEYGVVDRWWGGVKVFTSPLLYVPVLTHVEYWPKCQVPVDQGLQTLTTACGKTVGVNATTIVKITDPVVLRVYASIDDWEVWASMKIRGIVQEVVTAHNWGQSIDTAADFIEIDAYSDLLECGLEVQQVVLEDSCEVLPLRLLGNTGG